MNGAEEAKTLYRLAYQTLRNIGKLARIDITWPGDPDAQTKQGHFVLNRYIKKRCLDFDEAGDYDVPAIGYQYQYTRQYLRYEPRIFMLYRSLQAIERLAAYRLDAASEKVKAKILGMALGDPGDWYQQGNTPRSLLAFLTGPCLVSCTFCSRKGTSPDHIVKLRPHTPSRAEIQTRLKYYRPGENKILFYTINSVPDEILTHPLGVEVMKQVREKTPQTFILWTNGKPITERNVQALKELMPIDLDVSLNSASPHYRRQVMNDGKPQIARDSLKLLKEHQVPYSVGIVLWPELPPEDVLATIDYAIEQDADSVYLHLPAYSRYFTDTPQRFDLEETWSRYVKYLAPHIARLDTPIWYSPHLFVENYFEGEIGQARILGVFKNSPAHRAGIKKGDIILAVNGLPIRWRTDVINLFFILGHRQVKRFSLKVQRGQTVHQFDLNLPREKDEFQYPYLYNNPRFLGGIILNMTVDRGALQKLDKLIRQKKAAEVLFLSSWLVKPHMEKLMELSGFNTGKPYRLTVEVPKNIYFGNNIRAGDLLVNSDFIACIKKFQSKTGIKPDLIVIPSSPFTQWGRDLNGNRYTDIETAVRIPVSLLQTRLLDT